METSVFLRLICKKTSIVIWVFMFLFPSHRSFAESIDGPANIREKPNGKVVLSLNDGVRVECSSGHENWHLIGFEATFKKTAFSKPGIALFNREGNKIGVTASVLEENYFFYDAEYDKLTGRYIATFVLYTHKNNIRKESTVENGLERVLNKSNVTPTMDYMKQYIAEYEYEDWINERGFATYLYYESWMDDPSPGPRVVLFFYNNKLVSVVHSRKINIKNFKAAEKIDGLSVKHIDDINLKVKKLFEDTYIPIFKNSD